MSVGLLSHKVKGKNSVNEGWVGKVARKCDGGWDKKYL